MGTRANPTAAKLLTALLCLFAMLLGTAASCQAEAQLRTPQASTTIPWKPMPAHPMEMACCHPDHGMTRLAACCSVHPQPADQASQNEMVAPVVLPSTRITPVDSQKPTAVAASSRAQISPPPLYLILRI